jgi:hypothetical protein
MSDTQSSQPPKQPIVAGATPDERDPAQWPAEAFEAIQLVLDRSRDKAGKAVLDTFDHTERRLTARQFVELWNSCRLKAMATVGAKGKPHIAPVHAEFVSGRLRSTIFEDAVRLRDIETNPDVAFTTWGPNGASAIVYGRARVLPGSQRDSRPGARGAARRTVALEIDLTRIYAMKGRGGD